MPTNSNANSIQSSNPTTFTATGSLQAIQNMTKNPFVSIQEVLSHKLTMFNFRLPNDRNMYESSLIYCNLCDYSCDLSDKSAIICHFVAKHAQDNIVYSYLWPQMELNQHTNQFKIKYYLIKAHLKIRAKDQPQNYAKPVEFPNTLLSSDDTSESLSDSESEAKFMLDKMLDWIEKVALVTPAQLTGSVAATAQDASDVQELEEEQEVQEVEMTGEDLYDPTPVLNSESSGSSSSLAELVKLTSSALFQISQQRLTSAAFSGTSTSMVPLQLENNYLVHLLAINKSENVFRVKQIHDYYGGCFICGKQVEFNMKHYQVKIKIYPKVYFLNRNSHILYIYMAYFHFPTSNIDEVKFYI